MIHPLLPKCEAVPFSSPKQPHILLPEKYLLYLSGMCSYISLMFEQALSGLFQMKVHGVNSCYYQAEMQQKNFTSKWMHTLLPEQVAGCDSQRILVLLVFFSLLLEYNAWLQHPRRD